jgi:hypothetical protein
MTTAKYQRKFEKSECCTALRGIGFPMLRLLGMNRNQWLSKKHQLPLAVVCMFRRGLFRAFAIGWSFTGHYPVA